MNQPFTRIAVLLLLSCLGALQVQAGPAKARTPATAIPVEVGVKLDQITNIDQKAENFTAMVTVLMNYRDPKLVYERDPDEPAFRMMETAGFLKLVQQKQSHWPAFIFQNRQGRRDTVADLISLFPDGEVRYYERSSVTFQAPDFDFRHFPFDSQVFYIRILSLMPDDLFVYRELKDQTGIGDQLGEEEWVVSEVFSSIDSDATQTGIAASRFSLSFRAHRHLLYYLMRMFIPMLIILLVSWFTFQLRDYVKRVDMGITVLLLFIAFNFTLSGDLPRLGYVTAMDAFLTATFAITGAVILVNVYLRRLQTQGRDERAARLDRFAIWGYWPAYLVGMSAALLTM